MSLRADHEGIETPGQDSFLDVITNLVGILLILVMVVGIRAQGAIVKLPLAPSSTTVSQQTLSERNNVRKQADNLRANVMEIQHRADQIGELVAQRQQERHQLNVLMTAARLELSQRAKTLSQSQQDQVKASLDVQELERQLLQVQSQQRTLSGNDKSTVVLEHFPTPLAQTVFGREEHFRLLGGRLVFVPLNELTDQLRDAAERQIHRLKDVPQISETIGPMQGFYLRYTLQRRELGTLTRLGPAVRQVIELKQFTLVPSADDLGEPLVKALQPASQFRQVLDSLKPGTTVITVWTYPDSYSEFRQLKSWLYERGFSTAARPLPAGQPIGGSPSGTRSAAQ
jgi:hypothetical protein